MSIVRPIESLMFTVQTSIFSFYNITPLCQVVYHGVGIFFGGGGGAGVDCKACALAHPWDLPVIQYNKL